MKYHIITHGCDMNKSDSERIAGLLRQCGWEAAESTANADLVIINTCSVRQSAEDRVFGEVTNLAKLKKQKPELIVAVTGCMPGRDKIGRFWKKMTAVDLYFPISDLAQLPEMLMSLRATARSEAIPSGSPLPCGPRDNVKSYLEISPHYTGSKTALVPIQTGCNKFCTYCVVPFSRGREIGRPLSDILAEVRRLAESGYTAVTLLGQTVNSYVAPDPQFSAKNPFKNHFAALLWELNQLTGLKRISFQAAHPDAMTEEVILALGLPKLVNYLHLPVQAGSDTVLKRMNRHYTAAEFLEIIKKVRAVRPNIALGTDIIVGFPGETEEDFQKTVGLYKQADFVIAYLAKYSPRSGTSAFNMTDDVMKEEKSRRWWTLQHLMEDIVLRKNQVYNGQTVEVLVGGCKDGICFGNSREMKYTEFPGQPDLVGRLVNIKVTRAEMWRLIGQLNS